MAMYRGNQKSATPLWANCVVWSLLLMGCATMFYLMFLLIDTETELPVDVDTISDMTYQEILDKLDKLEQRCWMLHGEVLVYREWFDSRVGAKEADDFRRQSNPNEGNRSSGAKSSRGDR